MNIKTVGLLVLLYIILGVVGRFLKNYIQKKTVLMLANMCKTGIFFFAFFSIFVNDFPRIADIIRSKNLTNLSIADAAIFIGIILAIMDIIDSWFEWVDLASGSKN